MTTMTDDTLDTQLDTNPVDLDLDPIDTEALTEDYAAGATPSKRPVPGAYTLQLPSEFPDASFEIRTRSGQKVLQITLDNQKKGDEGQGLTILDGPYAGAQARYIRITTAVQNVYQWNESAGRSEIVMNPATGRPKVFIDALDLLRRFDPNAPTPATVDEWKTAIRALAGQTIPDTVYLTWEGAAKGIKVLGRDGNSYPKRIYAREFRASGRGKTAVYNPFIDLTAEVSFEEKQKDGSKKQILIGESFRVFPNLVLGKRALAPRK